MTSIFYKPCWHLDCESTNPIQDLIGCLERIISCEKVVAVVLSTYHVPKTRCCKTVIWVHLVLETCLITVNFFQIIYDFYVRLDLIFLFGCVCSFLRLRLIFLNLAFRSLLFINDSLIYFGSSAASWTSWVSLTSLILILKAFFIGLNWWNVIILTFVREGILRARLTHWIIK